MRSDSRWNLKLAMMLLFDADTIKARTACGGRICEVLHGCVAIQALQDRPTGSIGTRRALEMISVPRVSVHGGVEDRA